MLKPWKVLRNCTRTRLRNLSHPSHTAGHTSCGAGGCGRGGVGGPRFWWAGRFSGWVRAGGRGALAGEGSWRVGRSYAVACKMRHEEGRLF